MVHIFKHYIAARKLADNFKFPLENNYITLIIPYSMFRYYSFDLVYMKWIQFLLTSKYVFSEDFQATTNTTFNLKHLFCSM